MKHSLQGNIYLKIALITSVLIMVIQGGNVLLTEKKVENNIPEVQATGNETQYKSAYSANFGSIGVALSTRVGMQYQSENSSISSQSFYREIASVGNNSEEKRIIRADMIAQNMLIIQEYLNLSRSDVKSMLDSSSNRRTTLESYLTQLEMRYKNSALSVQSLEKQKALLVTELDTISTKIENTKVSMEQNFSASLASNTLVDVDAYYALRADYTEAFTDIVFINQFIKQHNFLNNYNKVMLDTLINNKEAIINQSYVVIPDSGDQLLRPLELLFNEADFKAQQNTSE